MYLEGIKDGRRLMEIARRSPKPIIVHKSGVGRAGAASAAPHTAALASDDKDSASKAADEVLQTLNVVEMSLLSGNAHNVWMASSAKMKEALETIKQAKAIEPMREGFEKLSIELIAIVGQFGVQPGKTLYKMNCPMAFNNKGADWLQTDEDIRNPYFGASMYKCGQVIEVISKKQK